MAAGAAPRRLGARSERAAHADAGTGYQRAERIRFSAFSSRLLSVLAVRAAADAVRDHACTAGSICRSISRCSTPSRSMPVVSISNAQRRPLPQANWVRTVHHGLPEQLLTPQPIKPSLFRFPRPHRAGEGHRSRHPHRRTLRRAAQSRGQGRSGRPRILRRAHSSDDRRRRAMSNISARSATRKNPSFLSGAIGAAGSDRLARAVRPGDDRSDGLRHAGHRL